jgi:hypothetical protein
MMNSSPEVKKDKRRLSKGLPPLRDTWQRLDVDDDNGTKR